MPVDMTIGSILDALNGPSVFSYCHGSGDDQEFASTRVVSLEINEIGWVRSQSENDARQRGQTAVPRDDEDGRGWCLVGEKVPKEDRMETKCGGCRGVSGLWHNGEKLRV
jgi:hypothetical protein